MPYVKRYAGGFLDLPTQTTPVDSQFLNAVESALLKLLGVDPTVDGQIPLWSVAGGAFTFGLIKNANIDPAAAIDKTKLGPLSIVDADIAAGANIALSKLASGGGVAVYNVKSYGAKGDGITDDTTKIAAAITACSAAGGGIVYFPAGSYYISATLSVGAYVSLLGDGTSATKLLHKAGAVPLVKIVASVANRQFVRDLAFVGTGVAGSVGLSLGAHLAGQAVGEVRCEDLLFDSLGSWAITAYNAIACSFRDIKVRSGGGGISLADVSNACRIDNLYVSGGSLNPGLFADSTTQDGTYTNVIVESVTTTAIQISGSGILMGGVHVEANTGPTQQMLVDGNSNTIERAQFYGGVGVPKDLSVTGSDNTFRDCVLQTGTSTITGASNRVFSSKVLPPAVLSITGQFSYQVAGNYNGQTQNDPQIANAGIITVAAGATAILYQSQTFPSTRLFAELLRLRNQTAVGIGTSRLALYDVTAATEILGINVNNNAVNTNISQYSGTLDVLSSHVFQVQLVNGDGANAHTFDYAFSLRETV